MLWKISNISKLYSSSSHLYQCLQSELKFRFIRSNKGLIECNHPLKLTDLRSNLPVVVQSDTQFLTDNGSVCCFPHRNIMPIIKTSGLRLFQDHWATTGEGWGGNPCPSGSSLIGRFCIIFHLMWSSAVVTATRM